MIRRPPRSTLFPTRRSSDLLHAAASDPAYERYESALLRAFENFPHIEVPAWKGTEKPRMRSEEHTSELQSRLHLVCRLLLEKKKKKLQPQAVMHIRICHTSQ